MGRQLYWEDIQEGAEIPALIKQTTTRQLVQWAGASGDFYEIHYDKDFALRAKLPSVIVHGWLTFSFLTQMLTDWIGEDVWVKKAGVSYRAMHVAGEHIYCGGKVIRKFVENGEHLIECQIWAENDKAQITVPGTALLLVPPRTDAGQATVSTR
jgi:acyl dehydratase